MLQPKRAVPLLLLSCVTAHAFVMLDEPATRTRRKAQSEIEQEVGR